MLSSVIGSAALARLRVATGRWSRLVGVSALAVIASLPGAALAQPADAGWFDPPSAGPADPAPPPARPAPPPQQPSPAEAQQEVADTDPSALTTFRPVLDPYGSWVHDSKYGTVWVPHREAVGDDFAPYVSRGHWALTADDDWIWVSDYPFGWAVFHYGRWVWVGGRGWAWVPGRTYANAWVVWRVPTAGYGYVGWAPMPPSYVWMNGYAVSLYYGPPLPYVFCPSSYVFHRHVHHYIVRDRHHVHRIAANTRVYPTTYRTPARPTRHVAASPSARTAPPPTAAPRGPGLASARVPREAIPARRAAPPESAMRLAPRRAVTGNVQAPRTRAPAPVATPPRSYAPERRTEPRAPIRPEAVRRDVSPPREHRPAPAPVRVSPEPRAPSRLRAEPRSVAPVRARPAPSRDLAPASRRMRRP